MSITLNLVVLRCLDISRAAEFYSRLGLRFSLHRHGNGPEHYAAEIPGSVFELYPLAPGRSSTYAAIYLTLEAMKLFRPIIIVVCVVASFVANAGEQLTANAKGAANQPTPVELKPLQGTWEGVMVGDNAHQKLIITITGNSFHFHRDTNFWFETTITLPSGTNPKQLHATIKGCPPSQASSIGQVVVAIFKIEDGTLTLATGNGDGEAPKSFESTGDNGPNRYQLRKVLPQKKIAEPPKPK